MTLFRFVYQTKLFPLKMLSTVSVLMLISSIDASENLTTPASTWAPDLDSTQALTGAEVCHKIRDSQLKVLSMESRRNMDGKIEFYLVAEGNYLFVVPFTNFTYGPKSNVSKLVIGGDYQKANLSAGAIESNIGIVRYVNEKVIIGDRLEVPIHEFIECNFPKEFQWNSMTVITVSIWSIIPFLYCAISMAVESRMQQNAAAQQLQWMKENGHITISEEQSSKPESDDKDNNKLSPTSSHSPIKSPKSKFNDTASSGIQKLAVKKKKKKVAKKVTKADKSKVDKQKTQQNKNQSSMDSPKDSSNDEQN